MLLQLFDGIAALLQLAVDSRTAPPIRGSAICALRNVAARGDGGGIEAAAVLTSIAVPPDDDDIDITP